MGRIVIGTIETAGEGGPEPKLLTSVIVDAPGRHSVGRVVAGGEDAGFNELAGVGDELNPLAFATLETLAFTRTVGLGDGLSGERRGEDGVGGAGWNEPLLRRAPTEEASSAEVKERCLDNSCGTREAFGLETWTSTADRVDESFLAWPYGGLAGDGGRVVDLTVELPVLDDEDDRPTPRAALLLILAFGRKVGSASMDGGGGGGGDLDFDGEGGREEGLEGGLD
jgi:hypothetical protein